MRLDRYLLISILALLTFASTPAAQLNQPELSTRVAAHLEEESGRGSLIDDRDRAPADVERAPVALERASPKRPANVNRAYADTFQILQENNTCSQFFGGPVATQVLNKLVDRLSLEPLSNPRVGIRMQGEIENVTDASADFSYRLFEKAIINSNGPFCKRKRDPSEPLVPHLGSFAPNTREVRVAILLHELAHLVRAPDRNWLIPDDGGNPNQSARNTETIETICGAQIRALKDGGSDRKLTPERRSSALANH
jgi:hypothetical protein